MSNKSLHFTGAMAFVSRPIKKIHSVKFSRSICYTSLSVLFCILLSHIKVCSQNLIANPGAELPPVGNGWTQVSGNWQQRTTDPDPYEGNAYFFAGVNALAELFQDINVSSFASNIDNGLAYFNFSGYVRSFLQSPSDESQIIVEYRNTSGNVLSSFTSQKYNSTSQWVRVSNTTIAPLNTRTVRVRLIADRNSGSNNDGYFDALSLIISTSAPLPVKLLSFTAEKAGHANNLVWRTAEEVNSEFFNVQRSLDGVNFTIIAKIYAIGSSNAVHTYTYSDDFSNLLVSKVYYRLQEVDKDGKIISSNIVFVKNTLTRISFVPNPATTHIQFYSNDVKEIAIRNSEGKLVIRRQIVNSNIVDVSRLSKGVYFVLITDKNDAMQTEKLIIQ